MNKINNMIKHLGGEIMKYIILLVFLFIVLFLYCALRVAGEEDKDK